MTIKRAEYRVPSLSSIGERWAVEVVLPDVLRWVTCDGGDKFTVKKDCWKREYIITLYGYEESFKKLPPSLEPYRRK